MSAFYNENDLIARIEDELKYDPLYNQIKERSTLKNDLFDSVFIESLQEDMHRWYSIAEAGRILGGDKAIAASTLKHYIDNLDEYVLPDEAPHSKYVRLNYLSIIKLRMIWLLKDELKLSGLKAEVGIIGSPIKNQTFSPSTEDNSELRSYMQMTNLLATIFMETDENGRPQLKREISSLMQNNQKLLESANFMQVVGEHKQTIDELKEKLNEESEKREDLEKQVEEKYIKQLAMKDELIDELKNELDKRQESLSDFKSEIDKTFEKKVDERESKFLEMVKKDRMRSKAKQLAEEEWDKQGAFKRAFGKRSEFINTKINHHLSKLDEED
ncbi:hypothetical protein [Cytobacillus sp. IB215665]|uniref:hypothetical protein n=1 Tax=Cytobacillus sp. IB215665 TaxID=3097357 RepID=UPI002A17990F|nr:hypothetical protein [Cytobacillus sp. IB215665]MDX8367929.1 hypothetical protein [Cytobacillus sp. IB215665]